MLVYLYATGFFQKLDCPISYRLHSAFTPAARVSPGGHFASKCSGAPQPGTTLAEHTSHFYTYVAKRKNRENLGAYHSVCLGVRADFPA